jgi:tRNA nucleotidyltransferase (CCA-adding enzyme)
VVEGDGVIAARELNARLGGKLTTHPEFGTATISIDSHRVDLASARTEHYPLPAHLPHVFPSTIVEDLNRRDFTINAIAMSISKENFGEIFDPFEGLSDIKKKLIRILQKNSFIDDPTRVFRALRYKNRFAFKLEDDTERLMKEAIRKGMVDRLSGQRILNELQLIFEEDTFLETAEDLVRYGVFDIKRSDLRSMPRSSIHAHYFFLSRLDQQRIPLPRDTQKIVHDFRVISGIITKLGKANKKSTIFKVLSPIAQVAIEAIPLIKPELKDKVTTFYKLRKIKPLVTGIDLRRHGVKPVTQYARILRQIHSRQMDGELKNRRQALKYLKDFRSK